MIRMIYKFKPFIFIFMIFFVSFASVACTLTATTSDSGFDYSDFSLLLVSDPDMQLNLSDEPYYVYYFGETCFHCNAIKQTVLTKIFTLTNDQVFLVDVKSTDDVMNGIAVTDTPSLIKVENHLVVSIYEGDSEVLAAFADLS